mmetsp:Transcript_16574/g.55754  ORF Transcript_16574/g.55754 Transcript_16574/m.55754 type:complete len:144 (+) Transcript_16574:351-782(+)
MTRPALMPLPVDGHLLGAVNRAVVRDEQTGFLDEEGEAASPASFLEVQAAFDAVIDALDHPEGTEGEEGGKRKRRPDRREKTLGELLVERLGEEPETVAEVWDEIREQNLEATNATLSSSTLQLEPMTRWAAAIACFLWRCMA